MSGRTWKNIEISNSNEIKKHLILLGGIEKVVKGEHEEWQIKFSDSIFTFYKTGTLYCSPSNSKDPIIFEVWEYIENLTGPRYEPSTKDFLIGFDETGKGEVIGHTILTGAIFPKSLFTTIDDVIGSADTKKKHPYKYWDALFKKIDRLKIEGLEFVVDKIPPWTVDKYHFNKILDITYQRILNIFYRNNDLTKARIVIDDYKIGDTLRRFLNFLGNQGSEIVTVHNAEDSFLEAKLASLISKRHSQAVLRAVTNNPKFQLRGISIGSGNAGDSNTIKWLENWYKTGKEWPWFIKTSFKTIRTIEGKKGSPRKIIPPINDRLISKESKENFDKGELSIQSLSVVCPQCGEVVKSMKFIFRKVKDKDISQLICPNENCKAPITNGGLTLRYYCGFLIPDSNAIRSKILSRDLQRTKIFENFNIVLSPVVRKECNGLSGAKQEFEALHNFNSIGRIILDTIGDVTQIPDSLSNTERDELIIQDCLDLNAILLTADKSMAVFASGKKIFTIQT
ncbi:MAG: hypothetical protein PVF83_18820 [Anaerolineales bacterium]|jgi:ribonuclease HII